jgi:hypothetical protein
MNVNIIYSLNYTEILLLKLIDFICIFHFFFHLLGRRSTASAIPLSPIFFFNPSLQSKG